jgi:hypothetical protein
MHPKWFGDSFDLVKRYFIEVLSDLNYEVFVDPMITEAWSSKQDEKDFYKLLKALPVQAIATTNNPKALLVDPDTGVGKTKKNTHVTIDHIVHLLQSHEIVFSFDQSFSRSTDQMVQLQSKLEELKRKGCHGFYYDSHARFLFASKSYDVLRKLEDGLISSGLPKRRLIHL